MVGDSAGGNLTFSVCLRLIELNAKRLPNGLVPMYTPFLFQVFLFLNFLTYIVLVFAIAISSIKFYGSTLAHGRCNSLCGR